MNTTSDSNAFEAAVSRRRALLLSGKSLLALGALPAAAALATDPTPSLTQGPYWVDEGLNRIDVRGG